MRLFGMEIALRRAAPDASQMYPVFSGNRGGWFRVLEPFAGAWQRNVEEKRADLLTYPTLYACVSRIATDIGKLPFCLKATDQNGISGPASSAQTAAYTVLSAPNGYQTQGQFREAWIVSKLTHGNTLVLKERDGRGVVSDLYVLDPERVLPLVTNAGEVYYRLYTSPLHDLPPPLSGDNLIVPASEIIHDRCVALHHDLIGVPPLAAAYWPALKNMKIMRSETQFFANNAQPGGLLTAPAGMSEKDADAVKDYWNTNFTGQNSGRVAVIGADMKFTPFAMKSVDSQLVDQMQYSDQQICQPFGISPFKVGIGAMPTGMTADDLTQMYYSDALQTHIERMEELLTAGLKISSPLSVELDLSPLLRMNEAKRAAIEVSLVGGKLKTPDEGRKSLNMPTTAGGNTLWGQQQDYPLGVLADRQQWDPQMQPPAPPAPAPVPADAPAPADPPPDPDKAMQAELDMHRVIAAARKRRKAQERKANV